eukprot:jgi/Ulvmu1/10191/UM006_0147.1
MARWQSVLYTFRSARCGCCQNAYEMSAARQWYCVGTRARFLNNACIAAQPLDSASVSTASSALSWRMFTSRLGSMPEKDESEPSRLAPAEPRMVKLYRGPWIRTVAFVMRVKVLQLVATGAAALPLLLHLKGEAVDTGEVIGSALLTSFAGIASWALWFYGQRYIGELALVYVAAERAATAHAAAERAAGGCDAVGAATSAGSAEISDAAAAVPALAADEGSHGGESGVHSMHLQISTLDFWGRRQDVLMEAAALEPPLAGLQDAQLRALAAATFLPMTVRGSRQYLLSLRHGALLQPLLLRQVLAGRWAAARASVRALHDAAPAAAAASSV